MDSKFNLTGFIISFMLLCIVIGVIVFVAVPSLDDLAHSPAKYNTMVLGTWSSEDIFGEDVEHIKLVFFSDETGTITQNEITYPFTWYAAMLGYRITISEKYNVQVAIRSDHNTMYYGGYYNTLNPEVSDIILYRVEYY